MKDIGQVRLLICCSIVNLNLFLTFQQIPRKEQCYYVPSHLFTFFTTIFINILSAFLTNSSSYHYNLFTQFIFNKIINKSYKIKIQTLRSNQMQDKIILNNFSAKISKAKNLHDSTTATCQKLKKQSDQLQKQLNLIRSQRQSGEVLRDSLKNQLELTTTNLNHELQKCSEQTSKLKKLKEEKKQLTRSNQVLEALISKQGLQLQDLQKKRQNLQNQSLTLAQRLKETTNEKQSLESQYNKTKAAVKKYDEDIYELKNQIQHMKIVIEKNTKVNIVGEYGSN